MLICLEQGATGLHMVQLIPLHDPVIQFKIKIGLTFLVSAYPVCPGKQAFKDDMQ